MRSAILAIFFWASLFSLFPIAIGHYFGEASAGGNYGVLYAIAKGSGGLYGGILSTILISQHGFPFAITIAGVMAIVAGLILVCLSILQMEMVFRSTMHQVHMYRLVAMIVPVVPMLLTKCVIKPRVSVQISGPVLS